MHLMHSSSYIQLYDCFLSFYYSSLTFDLSNKTALNEIQHAILTREGQVESDKSSSKR